MATQTRWWSGPVKAQPNFENLLAVLRREKPDRPTLFEFFMNERLYRLLAGLDDAAPVTPETMVLAFRNAGYDYATIGGSDFRFPRADQHSAATLSLNDGSLICDRASFEKYPWPDPVRADYSALDRAAAVLPVGMKILTQGPSGVLENVSRIVGFDNLCFILADDPDLAADIFDAVGSRLLTYYEIVVRYEAVGCIFGNDDWGFKTQPMLSPDQIRRYVMPWHKRIVATAHAAGKPAVMHSCGNLTLLMDDIIDVIGYDGKHSYEDAIQPVEDAYETYGRRIAILGGLDVDFVIRSTPEAVYRRSKAMLERSAGRGGYALGTGNSVPGYVPDEHYLAMIAAANASR
jgi:uroporphyrinogen decarboxylase